MGKLEFELVHKGIMGFERAIGMKQNSREDTTVGIAFSEVKLIYQCIILGSHCFIWASK